MDSPLNLQALLNTTRGRVYLLWAVLVGVGYVATHFYQVRLINGLWLALSILGLGYMFRVMPLRLGFMKRIYLSWLVPITIGMAVSGLAFYITDLAGLIGKLGAFWLLVQAVGFLWNGLVDRPGLWYFIAAGVNLAAGLALFVYAPLLPVQYLIAAIVSVWSMVMLFLFRSE